MPLTPRFTLRQTATHVYVEISIPSFRLSLPLHDAEQEEEGGGGGGGMEVVLTGAGNSCFHFYAQPYLLKLNFFPHQFYNDDEDNEATAAGTTPAVRETAKYDPAEQTVAIPLRKKLRTTTTTTSNNKEKDRGGDEETNTYWPDLDLTARLVEPTEIPKQWLHAVVDNTNTNVNDNDNDNDTTDTTDDTNTTTAKNDKEANSNGPDHDDENALETTRQPTNPLLLPGHETKTADGYGFQTMFRNIFTDYCRSGLAEEMLQLRGAVDPEASTLAERQGQRHATEEHDFDFDRYYHDLDLAESDDYLYPLVMHYQPWWKWQREQQPETIRTTQAQNNSKSKNKNGASLGGLEEALESKLTVTPSSSDRRSNHNNEKDKVASSDPPPIAISIFTEDEKLLLTTIPYPLLPENLLSTQNDTITTTNTTTDTKNYDLWCGLIEIVLAYVYDHVTTMGDPTVESAWTISILSPGLSYLESPHPHTASIENVLYTCLRRVAIYPYWRNIDELGLYHIIRETLDLIKMHGIHGITKCLLQTRVILEKSESYYLGNKLFIDPYLYWIQNLNQAEGKVILNRIVSEMEDVVVAAPCDNTLLMKVQNSLGIDVLMDDLFHTDSETGSFSVSSSDGDDDDDDDDDDSETDTTTETELDENDESNDDEENDSDNDILVKDATAALSAVSIRVDGTQNGADDDRLLVDRGTSATISRTTSSSATPTKEKLACSSPAAGNNTDTNETTITATEKMTKSSKLLLHFEDKNINNGITKTTAKKTLITEL